MHVLHSKLSWANFRLCVHRDREPVRLRKPAPAPKKASPPRRREPDYLVRLSTRPVTIQDRDYNDVIDRYPRLYVSADFAKSISSWVQVLQLISLSHLRHK